MISLIFDIALISAGILLAQVSLMKYDAIDETVDKLAGILSGFQGIIGGLTLVLGVLRVLGGGCTLMSIAGVLAGLVLLGVSLKSVPAIGEFLNNASTALKAFSIPIGLAALASGVLHLLNFCF